MLLNSREVSANTVLLILQGMITEIDEESESQKMEISKWEEKSRDQEKKIEKLEGTISILQKQNNQSEGASCS